MEDKTTTVDELLKLATQFINERDWDQFHDLKNLSMNTAVEASELMEIFTWCRGDQVNVEYKKNAEHVQQEVADVLWSLLLFANKANIDLTTALKNKLALTAIKYPIEQSKGKYTKYTYLKKD